MEDIVVRLEREARRKMHEPIWRDAVHEIQTLRHALLTMLGDTEDADYMSHREVADMARKALHNA